MGNGFVFQTANSALRISDTRGSVLIPTTSLNTFYGYPPARTLAGEFSPAVGDPSCHFDPDTERWFHLATTVYRMGTTAQFSGITRLDLAISRTSNPLGAWNIYSIPTQNDGTEGTPDHDCLGGPCAQDYPQFALNAHGVYITTDEFGLFVPGLVNPRSLGGAQVYALSKRALVRGRAEVPMVLFDTAEEPYLLDGNRRSDGLGGWHDSTGNAFRLPGAVGADRRNVEVGLREAEQPGTAPGCPEGSTLLPRRGGRDRRPARGLPNWAAGYTVRLVDGSKLTGTEQRLEELRTPKQAAMPGQSLVVLDPRRGLVCDGISCEDAHAPERALVSPLIDTIRERGARWPSGIVSAGPWKACFRT